MSFEGLPEELTTLILVKLPVKSLLRCKCVRKSWYSLIKSPQFIHLHRKSSSSSPQFLIRRVEGEDPRHILSLHSYSTLAHLGNDIHIPFSDPPFSGFPVVVSLSGSCDGLVVMTNDNDQIFICNPATRELRSLFVPPSRYWRSGYHIDSVAFGADPNTAGKYKVVMIGVPYDNSAFYDPEDPDESCFNYTPEDDRLGDREARVYDFSTDSWRETAVVIPGPSYRYSRSAVTLNGAFHWLPHTSGDIYIYDDLNDILTFDISDEVTGSIPLPDFVNVKHENVQLWVSRKSQLSLVVWAPDSDLGGRYEVCVMTEYGVKESWTRLFQIGPLLENSIDVGLAFWDEQKPLLVTVSTLTTVEGQLLLCDLQGQLVSCDLQDQSRLQYFPIFGVWNVCLFSETLVSVNMLP